MYFKSSLILLFYYAMAEAYENTLKLGVYVAVPFSASM